ncbi:unnamed protein product [Durusdinium trenchii]|uniref:Uncharacterized protein n=1 Tax=Durusdinium trenchii TaxID=1381693 RepID=A0ABP0R6U5_9DINO
MLPRDDRGKKPKALERAPDPTRPKVQVGSGSKDITQEALAEEIQPQAALQATKNRTHL